MRKTLASQQLIIDQLTEQLATCRAESKMLTEQNKFLITQSTSGQVTAMGCTVQRVAEATAKFIELTIQSRNGRF